MTRRGRGDAGGLPAVSSSVLRVGAWPSRRRTAVERDGVARLPALKLRAGGIVRLPVLKLRAGGVVRLPVLKMGAGALDEMRTGVGDGGVEGRELSLISRAASNASSTNLLIGETGSSGTGF